MPVIYNGEHAYLEQSKVGEISRNDPNDGCTQLRQEAARDGTSDDPREFEDSDAFKGLGVGC